MIRPCNVEAGLPSIKLIIKGICVLLFYLFYSFFNIVYFIIKSLIENFINYSIKNVDHRFGGLILK